LLQRRVVDVEERRLLGKLLNDSKEFRHIPRPRRLEGVVEEFKPAFLGFVIIQQI
jgi:hypothetical protein